MSNTSPKPQNDPAYKKSQDASSGGGVKQGDVTRAYQLILGRKPEGPEARNGLDQPDLEALGKRLITSPEFRKRYVRLMAQPKPQDARAGEKGQITSSGEGVKRGDVVRAYKLILGRKPEEPKAIQNKLDLPDLDTLGKKLILSPEFQRRYARLVPPSPEQSADPVVIHLHIPKTAGSSFNKLLADNYAGRFGYAFREMAAFKEIPADLRAKIDLIYGHMSYGVHELLRRNYIYLFVLRDPKARIYSFYKFLHKSEKHPLHTLVTEKNMSFGAFLDEAALPSNPIKGIDNAQTTHIAGIASTSRAEVFRTACQHCFAPTTEFGLLEEFPAFLDRLKHKGILTEINDNRLNTTNSSDTLSEALDALTPKQQDILTRYSEWDQRLYDLCKSYIDSAFKTDT
ncbi:Sulfotransferase family protein [Salinihabitans flavidus]|uniref:Sulfotransferase family protein n=1 Tax=Salinihabitans flavidus TaxID=569882 RepID=A0A1H8V2E8_9RHOB|nr:sulfotransferase family 2 domain-containing protein [Salinihabitans flavidus]SEP09403.1 Sulfotransferase family protein [Salinihabitans flavidus]